MPALSLRRALLPAALVCAAVGLAAPAAASASTWTVDDDKAQCPNAAFTSIQSAVDQAAPWDTVVVCQGIYFEKSTPLTHAQSPAQTGSTNGLTITKPLTIKGAGANKVTIRPAANPTSSLAGTAPYLRDGGGNVITISRQSLGSSDETENFVDISGVTVTSPDVYAEAGIAYFNTSGKISNSTVGPLKRAADTTALAAQPHGYGVIQTNSLQGAEAGSRRSLTIQNSLITGYQSGGVLFDDATGTDGAATNTVGSGLPMYGNISGTRIVGSGSSTVIPQNGVKYNAGARGLITGSEITGNYYSTDRRQSAGILLTNADTRTADPQNPAQPAFAVSGTSITSNGYGLFNADAANTAAPRVGAPALATDTWWGCAAGPVAGSPTANATASTCQGISGNDTTPAATVLTSPVLATAPTALAVPAATPDAPPTVSFSQPTDAIEVTAGEDALPTVIASDDFGVDFVRLTVDGTQVAQLGLKPYEASWIPPFSKIGETVTLRAAATDSSGQTGSATVAVKVVAPEGYVGLAATASALPLGSIQVGTITTGTVGLVNTGENTLDLTGVAVSGPGFGLVGPESTCATTLAPGQSCTLEVSFAPDLAGDAAGALTVTSAGAGAPEPIVVALSGSGAAVPVPVPVKPVAPSLDRTAPPAVVGTGLVGERLTCLPGTWSGASGFAYTWTRGGAAIPGQTGPSYRPTAADIASVVTCAVAATGPGGTGPVAIASGERIVYPFLLTGATTTEQVGGALLKLSIKPKVKKTKIAIGSLSCPRAVATSCTATVTGTIKIGKKKYKLSTKATVKNGATAKLAFTLTKKASKALKSTGALTLKVAVTDSTGLKATTTATSTATRS